MMTISFKCWSDGNPPALNRNICVSPSTVWSYDYLSVSAEK